MLLTEDLVRGDGRRGPVAGPDSDVILGGCIRLARNFAAWPFMTRMTDADREAMRRYAVASLETVRRGKLTLFEMSECDAVERHLLAERLLISEELAAAQSGAAAISDDETLSVVIGDEDHLQIQTFTKDSDLQGPLNEALQLSQDLTDAGVVFAISEEFGYLTASPMNTGTGMQASLILHL
ncbi:MAG: ATP--guanido phosphotransferase, partial [Planctomycetia bacterium]|nr:ATP--guanido phosphotransferase [Planctomycetia bacterium]